MGNSFGAGNYALCGKAYDPQFILAWPNAKYSVMGADQAANTLFEVQKKAAERSGKPLPAEELEALRKSLVSKYQEHMDIRYGAARGWVDAIIAPGETRRILMKLLSLAERRVPVENHFHTGVLQT